MASGLLEAALLDGVAGFAGALVDPFLGVAVLAVGTLVASPARARLAAAGLGLARGFWELATATAAVQPLAALLGALAAAALLVELVLQVLLPLARLGLRALTLLGALLARLR